VAKKEERNCGCMEAQNKQCKEETV